MKQVLTAFWKRCVGLATGFVSKYRYDPFFRTKLNVIGLQIIFTVFILYVLVGGMSLLYKNVETQLIPKLLVILRNDTSAPGVVAADLNTLKFQNIFISGALIACGTAIFMYLVTRLALAPARNALGAQKEFIGNIAHELRTPLSVIKTNTEVALLENHVSADVRETLTGTIEELDRISDIINNLLSLNVLVRPEEITFSNVDLGDVLHRVTKHLKHLIEKKHLEVRITTSQYKTVWGNTTALEQVVMNVLKNVAIYTPPNGKIAANIEPDYQGRVVLTIEDTGIGIEKKDLHRIFEPFFRTDQSRARMTGGSGLGLAIVSELVKLHQGSISIRSEKTKGTTVQIGLLCGRTTSKRNRKKSNSVSEIAVDYSTPYSSTTG